MNRNGLTKPRGSMRKAMPLARKKTLGKAEMRAKLKSLRQRSSRQ